MTLSELLSVIGHNETVGVVEISKHQLLTVISHVNFDLISDDLKKSKVVLITGGDSSYACSLTAIVASSLKKGENDN